MRFSTRNWSRFVVVTFNFLPKLAVEDRLSHTLAVVWMPNKPWSVWTTVTRPAQIWANCESKVFVRLDNQDRLVLDKDCSDVRVTKKSSGFVTSLYRKPTFPGLFTKWDSSSSTQYTAYQLARLVHRLATAGDEGNTTLACFYDLSKAFDRVWHKGLLAKLHHFGVRSHALAWITDNLSDRRQCVRIRNSTSLWLPVPAGVSQGSVLGPILFLAYTIDLLDCVRHPTQCDQFADNTALTTVSSSPRVCEEHLQQSVTATSTWLSNWRLTVNVEKTVTMAFTRRPFPSKVSINLNGNALSTQTPRSNIVFRPALVSAYRQSFVKSRTLTLHHHTSSAHAVKESPFSLLLSLHQTSGGVCLHSMAQALSSPT